MGSCFVCDEEVTEGICITVAETSYTKTALLTKISQLMGNNFMVIAREDDELCKRCTSLLNKSDKLEMDLMETHNLIKSFLYIKYNLLSQEDVWDESDISENVNEIKQSAMEVESRESELSCHKSDNIIMELLQSSDYSNNITENRPQMDLQDKQVFYQEVLTENDKVSVQQIKEEVVFVDNMNVWDGNKTTSHFKDEQLVSEQNIMKVPIDKQDNCNKSISSSLHIKMDTDQGCNESSIKLGPLWPKIIKPEDLLALSDFYSLEPFEHGQIIKLNKIKDTEKMDSFVDITSKIFENNAKVQRNCVISKRKKKDLCNEVFSCDVCGKICSSKNRLDMHKTIHEKRICDVCGRSFNSNYRLKVHRNIHTRLKKFTCNICGKSFIHHSTYWYHRKWHDNPYPYSCEFCEKKFKHSSILAIHRRKHTGERPYKCSYCPLAFAISTTMKKHEMLHTQDFAFSCDVCMKGFTTSSKYLYHMARVHKTLHGSERRRNKSDKKQKVLQNCIEACEPVNVQYSLLDTSEEAIVGIEALRRFKDVSIEVLDKESLQPVQNEDCQLYEFLNNDQFQLEGDVVEIVLSSENIVSSENMIFTDNMIVSQVDS